MMRELKLDAAFSFLFASMPYKTIYCRNTFHDLSLIINMNNHVLPMAALCKSITITDQWIYTVYYTPDAHTKKTKQCVSVLLG